MGNSTFKIAFEFPVEHSTLVVHLTAEVAMHRSNTFYLVSNFKVGRWVHIDSGKESALSEYAGKAIDEMESEQ